MSEEEIANDVADMVNQLKDIEDPDEIVNTLQQLMEEKYGIEDDSNYININGHKLSFTDAFSIKRSVDDMIKEWDFMIRKEIPFNDKGKIPLTMCTCGFNAIVPVDYYIDPVGHVVMCGECKNCGKYKEFTDMEMTFPFQFKDPPKERGIMFLSIKNKRDDKDMFI